MYLYNKKEIKLIGINNINNNRKCYERYYRKIFKPLNGIDDDSLHYFSPNAERDYRC